jgi:hypothetical protein
MRINRIALLWCAMSRPNIIQCDIDLFSQQRDILWLADSQDKEESAPDVESRP